MTDLNEMTIKELTVELNAATGKNLKKAKGSKETIIKMIIAARGPDSTSFIIIKHHKTERVDEWRIYLNEGGKNRWLNMKDDRESAEEAAKATATKRGIDYRGTGVS